MEQCRVYQKEIKDGFDICDEFMNEKINKEEAKNNIYFYRTDYCNNNCGEISKIDVKCT